MRQRVLLEPAFVLHRRPYRNTSLIIELLTMRYGRKAAVARSARGLQSRYKGKLESFLPLLVSWSGRRELMSLGQIELSARPFELNGRALLCGFYLNELLVRLLQRDDPYPNVFNSYQNTLQKLESDTNVDVALRCFEKNLLHELGYALPLERDAHSGEGINEALMYQYLPERGFLCCDHGDNVAANAAVFSGRSLLALQREQFDDEQSLQDAKRLMRLAMSHHLGNKPLKSRELMT